MIYDITAGIVRKDGIVFGSGYSGHGPGKNNPAMEGAPEVGPIPCGDYEICGPPFTSPKTGQYVLRLRPDAPTRARIITLGRNPDSFEWHGDSIEHPGQASDGCIVSPRATRVHAWQSGDRHLQAVSGIAPAPQSSQFPVLSLK